MRGRLRLPLAAGLLAAGLVAACAPRLPDAAPPPPTAAAPRPLAPPAPPPRAAPPDAASAAVAAHFERLQASLLARGLLRTDGGGPDTPFDARMLEENFVQIALRDEYVVADGRLLPRSLPAPLRRWEEPVRLSVEFGPSVPPERRARDLAEVAAYAARLSRVTRHPVEIVSGPGAANFHLLYLSESERRAIGPRLAALVPGIDPVSVATITDMPLSTYCAVIAFSQGGAAAYHRAVAVIRAEHPELMRLACLHEELAQGMGLANDSPRARPSIFNDDEEFALLTWHDELLLRILYDPRLRPGMTEAEARPIVARIAQELLGGTG